MDYITVKDLRKAIEGLSDDAEVWIAFNGGPAESHATAVTRDQDGDLIIETTHYCED